MSRNDKEQVVNNLLADLPADLPEELVHALIDHPSIRIEKIVSRGHASPRGFWYDQDEHEWVIVLSGAARLRFADDDVALSLQPGDYLNIRAHRKHRVEWTTADEPTVWLAVFYHEHR